MLEIAFKEDGKKLGTLRVEEGAWELSKAKSYERVYVTSHGTVEGHQVSMWVERPPRKKDGK